MTDSASTFPEHLANVPLHSLSARVPNSNLSVPDANNSSEELSQQEQGGTAVCPPEKQEKRKQQQIRRPSHTADDLPVDYSTLNTSNEGGHSRKRLRAATLRKGQKQGNKVKGRKLMFRCKPIDLLETIKSLSPAQVDEIRRLRWGELLKIKIDAVESRDLYCWLLDHLDIISMKLDISPDKQLPISAASVNKVLGVPLGGGDLTRVRMKQVTDARKLLREQLGISGDRITIKRLRDEVAKGQADELSMKCFFMIVFNRLLFSTAAFDVSNTDIMLTMDLNKIASIDWCKVVVEDIRGAAAAWQNRDQNFINASLHGCAPYLLIYYLDQLDHDLNNGNRISTPRAAFFDKRKVEHLTLSDKITQKNGRVGYGATQFRSQVGTCYHGSVFSTGVGYTCDASTGVGYTCDASSSSMQFSHLHCMLNRYSQKIDDRKQRVVLHKLVTALVSDLPDKMIHLESALQQLNSQIELIKAAQHKLAEDLCQLIGGEQENFNNIIDYEEAMEDVNGSAGLKEL